MILAPNVAPQPTAQVMVTGLPACRHSAQHSQWWRPRPVNLRPCGRWWLRSTFRLPLTLSVGAIDGNECRNKRLWSAKALLAATRQNDLAKPEQPKRILGMSPEQMARMEREMESLTRDFKALEETFGEDVLHLVLASRYLSRLLANSEIEAYLTRHHSDLLDEFRTIITSTSLDQAA